MDFDFGLTKRSSAKTGRRAKSSKSNTPMNSTEKGSEEKADAVTNNSVIKNVGQDSPPRPSRRMAGWGDEGPGRRDRNRAVEDSRLLVTGDSPKTKVDFSDDDDAIQVIPDLDDVQEEDLAQQMAAPPSIAMNQVATYRELDSDLMRHSTFTLLDNEIDLKLLSKHMSSEKDIREEDETWEWERLFTQVSSNIKSQVKSKSDS